MEIENLLLTETEMEIYNNLLNNINLHVKDYHATKLTDSIKRLGEFVEVIKKLRTI